eukprot:TRINITY_DN2267_c0_g1_i1.p1 TRINITY_DN2267_c0_g1~~TRINITY_DN2267_c0_g1_i1.p1  ORF type:complete len:630 (-),score=123.28 TRINITY_DN2267_c0_g1_i1:24-1913(-)
MAIITETVLDEQPQENKTNNIESTAEGKESTLEEQTEVIMGMLTKYIEGGEAEPLRVALDITPFSIMKNRVYGLLSKACEVGSMDVLRVTVDHFVNIGFTVQELTNFLLIFLTLFGRVEIVKEYLSTYTVKITHIKHKEDNLLFLALSNRNFDLATLYVDHGFRVDEPDEFGVTALQYACQNGQFKLAEKLLKKGASTKKFKKSKNVESLMHAAVFSKESRLIGLLVKHGEKIKGTHLLELSVHLNDVNVTKALLSFIPRRLINYTDLLCLASSFNSNFEVMELFLEKGARINGTGSKGNTPLFLAALVQDLEKIKFLVSKGARIEATSKNDQFEMFVLIGNTEIVSYLINSSIVSDDELSRGIVTSISNNNLDMLKCLISFIPSVNDLLYNGAPALFSACKLGRMEIMKYLIERGADPSIQSEKGWLPYEAAAVSGQAEVAHYMLINNLSCVVKKDQLEMALRSGSLDSVKHILEGVKLNTPILLGRTPLHTAAEYGTVEMIEYLLNEGADIHARDTQEHFAPIHFACFQKEPAVLECLLSRGASKDTQNGNDMTPLDMAVEKGNLRIVSVLLQSGAKFDKAKLMRNEKVLRNPGLVALLLDESAIPSLQCSSKVKRKKRKGKSLKVM